MTEQDWKVLVLRKDAPKPKQVHYKKTEGDVVAGEKPFKKIGTDFKISLLKARQDKKLSQKELANELCIKEAVIRDYESGKAIPNGNLINRLNLLLGIKLPKCKRPK
jgi:ribosome-binding protein aMBF1 (putative translation factor)